MVSSKPVYRGRVSRLPLKLLTSLSCLPRAGHFRPAPADAAHSGTEWCLPFPIHSVNQVLHIVPFPTPTPPKPNKSYRVTEASWEHVIHQTETHSEKYEQILQVFAPLGAVRAKKHFVLLVSGRLWGPPSQLPLNHSHESRVQSLERSTVLQEDCWSISGQAGQLCSSGLVTWSPSCGPLSSATSSPVSSFCPLTSPVPMTTPFLPPGPYYPGQQASSKAKLP